MPAFLTDPVTDAIYPIQPQHARAAFFTGHHVEGTAEHSITLTPRNIWDFAGDVH